MFACHRSDAQTKCDILLPLILLGTCYESSILVFFFAFLLLQEGKAHKQ